LRRISITIQTNPWPACRPLLALSKHHLEGSQTPELLTENAPDIILETNAAFLAELKDEDLE